MKILISTLFSLMMVGPASAGFDSGNAGDAFSAEFLFSGRDVLQRLEILNAQGKGLIGTKQLRAVMEKTQVVSEERVYLDGHERDAVNYPAKNLIKISRERWKDLRKPEETKARLRLALHEFLWVSGVDDTNFLKSNPIIEVLNVPPYSPSIWLNVPGKAFAQVECAGSLKGGGLAKLYIHTKGATKSPDWAEVSIEKGGNKFGYRFPAAEISQFFEFDDAASNWATVGLGAYVSAEFPVVLKYDGPNYVDQDLGAVLETGANIPGENFRGHNFMNIWKGHGFKAEEQYKLENPVCSVGSEN